MIEASVEEAVVPNVSGEDCPRVVARIIEGDRTVLVEFQQAHQVFADPWFRLYTFQETLCHFMDRCTLHL